MKTGRVGLGTDRRVSMKFHRIAWVMALMLASYWVPSALAQDSQKQDSKDQNTPSNTTQTEPQPVPAGARSESYWKVCSGPSNLAFANPAPAPKAPSSWLTSAPLPTQCGRTS